jgi:hypothetical protein
MSFGDTSQGKAQPRESVTCSGFDEPKKGLPDSVLLKLVQLFCANWGCTDTRVHYLNFYMACGF